MNIHRLFAVFRSTFLLAVLLIGFSPSSSLAMRSKQFMLENGLNFYGPEGGACTTAGAGYSTNLDLPSLVGNDKAEKIWRFLIEKGLTAEQAAGVMGNIQQESNFQPDLEESPESAAKHTTRPVGYGIAQWSGGRRTALEAAAAKQQVPKSDLAFQLAFMAQESQEDRTIEQFVLDHAGGRDFGKLGDVEWEVLKKQRTVEDATLFWHYAFERSGDSPEDVLKVRGGYAQNAFNSFKTLATPVAVPEAGSGGLLPRDDCAPFAGGDLKQTLLAYAHSTYTKGQYPLNPAPKPAYLEAATKAEKEGKWVGGGTAEIGVPGIDCGGFVSLLLVNSGFEPDYNFGLDMSRGASNQQFGQLPWAQKYWTFLGNGGDINVADLRPGDVAYRSGHTFVYVGQIDGFESQYASASYSNTERQAGVYTADNGITWRAPMSAGDWGDSGENATDKSYVWYGRREGSPEPYGSTNLSGTRSTDS